jgi:carboxypeptidase D
MTLKCTTTSRSSKCWNGEHHIEHSLTWIHRSHICGFDFNLTYPQIGKFPPVGTPITPAEISRAALLTSKSPAFISRKLKALAHASEAPEVGIVRRRNIPLREEMAAREEKRQAWLATKRDSFKLHQRDLTGRANGTLDPWYGCYLEVELSDYALNFSMPWS